MLFRANDNILTTLTNVMVLAGIVLTERHRREKIKSIAFLKRHRPK